MAEIKFLTGPNEGKRVQVSDAPMVIGRGADVDITLADEAASSRHAELQMVGGRAQFKDLGSSNGSKINGRRFSRRTTSCKCGSMTCSERLESVKKPRQL